MAEKIIPKEPGESIHPDDVYTPQAHEQNLSKIRASLAVFGTEAEDKIVTPWLKSPNGLVRVEDDSSQFKVDAVETREDGFFGLPPHFVKHIIKLDEEGIDTDTKTKIYMRLRQHLGLLFNYPISAGMMMGYPTLRYNPRATTEVLSQHLDHPDNLIRATRQTLNGLYIARSRVLEHWVGVKLPN